jgi:excisionase family DNA binding protein
MSRLCEIEDVAALMNVKKQHVRTMVREGIIPPDAVVRLGRLYRFNLQKVQEWIDRGGSAYPGGWRKEAA